MKRYDAFVWPTRNGKDVQTVIDPLTGLRMCRNCWNGKHSLDEKGNKINRQRCGVRRCECGCYRGKNKGLGKPVYPAPDCGGNQELPDHGAIEVP